MIAPIPKPAPASNGSAARETVGTIHNDAVAIFVHAETLEEMLDYSEQDVGRELGGFLIGGLHVDNRDYVEIRHFLPAVNARSRAASLTFTHATWSQLNQQVEQQFPDDIVLGWHHTHPNFGIFLSAYDMFIQRHFFSEPWQVAMVVDPQRHEFGFFQWRQGAVVDCGFIWIPSDKRA